MGNILKNKLFWYLVINREVIIFGTYILALLSPLQKILPFTSFLNFLETFGKRWDGNSYTFIATHGYVLTGPERNFIVFPPFYPLLIKIPTYLGINPVLSGVIISNLFFVFAMMLFYKLLRLDYEKRFSFFVIFLISIFPTSFFFSVAYPESLFVFLFVSAFYLARKKNYLYAGIIGGLATITRPFGIILAPALFVQIILNKDLNLKNFLSLSIPFLFPALYYLLLNYILFGDPFEFLVLLKTTWYKSFDYPWNGIIASWKRGINPSDSFTYKYFVGYGEAIASTLAWLAVPLGIKKWGLKSPYLVYLTLGAILFTSTSFILSAPRYLLSIPVFFILLASGVGSNKILKAAWIVISLVLLFYISYQFTWGRWTF